MIFEEADPNPVTVKITVRIQSKKKQWTYEDGEP